MVIGIDVPSLNLYHFSRMTDLLGSYFDFTAPSYRSHYFVVDENKQRQILGMDIQLADGYLFADLDPEVKILFFANSCTISFFMILYVFSEICIFRCTNFLIVIHCDAQRLCLQIFTKPFRLYTLSSIGEHHYLK